VIREESKEGDSMGGDSSPNLKPKSPVKIKLVHRRSSTFNEKNKNRIDSSPTKSKFNLYMMEKKETLSSKTSKTSKTSSKSSLSDISEEEQELELKE
jgi:hypothetical protein